MQTLKAEFISNLLEVRRECGRNAFFPLPVFRQTERRQNLIVKDTVLCILRRYSSVSSTILSNTALALKFFLSFLLSFLYVLFIV